MHARAARDFFEIQRLFRGNSTGDHQGRAAGYAPGNGQRSAHVFRGQGNDGQVRARLCQVRQSAGGVDVQKAEGAFESLGVEGLYECTRMCGLAAGIFGGPGKDDDGFRREEGGEVVFIHKFFSQRR